MAVKSSAILTLIRIDDASIRSATAPSDTTKVQLHLVILQSCGLIQLHKL
jgi:hypothetical protein